MVFILFALRVVIPVEVFSKPSRGFGVGAIRTHVFAIKASDFVSEVGMLDHLSISVFVADVARIRLSIEVSTYKRLPSKDLEKYVSVLTIDSSYVNSLTRHQTKQRGG